MEFDSVGLGYTAELGGVIVHYPVRQPNGEWRHAAGCPIGPVPSHYCDRAPNAITAERVQLRKRVFVRSRRTDPAPEET
jgi:hypothetical protein